MTNLEYRTLMETIAFLQAEITRIWGTLQSPGFYKKKPDPSGYDTEKKGND